MITLRPGIERGHTKLHWLDSYHTFCFDRYYDPRFMGFGHLRVINEDRVHPGSGFGMHSHRDMEIITYVLEGALEHKDSTGGGSIIQPGDAQRMSAGTGISHSEYNASKTEPVHFLQIWIVPEQKGLPPGYEQRTFKREEMQGQWRLLVCRDGRHGAVTVHQDMDLSVTALAAGKEISYELKPGRRAWTQMARGVVLLNSYTLQAGDGARVSEEDHLIFLAQEASEILIFDQRA